MKKYTKNELKLINIGIGYILGSFTESLRVIDGCLIETYENDIENRIYDCCSEVLSDYFNDIFGVPGNDLVTQFAKEKRNKFEVTCEEIINSYSAYICNLMEDDKVN